MKKYKKHLILFTITSGSNTYSITGKERSDYFAGYWSRKHGLYNSHMTSEHHLKGIVLAEKEIQILIKLQGYVRTKPNILSRDMFLL